MEIQKRCDLLVKVVEKENEEIKRKEKEEEKRLQSLGADV